MALLVRTVVRTEIILVALCFASYLEIYNKRTSQNSLWTQTLSAYSYDTRHHLFCLKALTVFLWKYGNNVVDRIDSISFIEFGGKLLQDGTKKHLQFIPNQSRDDLPANDILIMLKCVLFYRRFDVVIMLLIETIYVLHPLLPCVNCY